MHCGMMFYSHTIQHILHHFLFSLGSRLHSLSVHPNPVLWVRQQVTPFCQVSSTLVDITATKRFMTRFHLDVKSVCPDIKSLIISPWWGGYSFTQSSKQIYVHITLLVECCFTIKTAKFVRPTSV